MIEPNAKKMVSTTIIRLFQSYTLISKNTRNAWRKNKQQDKFEY